MKKIFLVIVLLCSSIFSQSNMHKLSPRVLDYNGAGNDAQILVWVFFSDKGVSVTENLYQPEKYLTQKSLMRRKKVSNAGTLINESDLPVNTNYIDKLVKSGFTLRHKSKWLNGVSGFIQYRDLSKIAQLYFVKNIDLVDRYKKNYNSPVDENISNEELKPLHKSQEINVYDYGNSLNQLQQINVPALHNLGYTGQGITICVLDAGFNRLSHESFSNLNIIAAWDFVNNDPDVGDGSDMGSGSHGTQTLSTIGGFKNAKLIGPAFGANYILAKTENTDSETPIEEDNWMAAIEWADSIGVDVTSTSLGYITFDPPHQSYTWQSMDGNTCRITRAADLAVAKGIVVLNSAGNEGFHSTHNTLGAPADGDSVIAVGAVGSSGTRSSFSSVGNTVDGRIKPDVMARGSSVTVASPSNNTGYTTASGTSFSCPLAAGVAALVLCVNPNLTPLQVREAMRNTASRSNNPDREYGWGILNALNASSYFPVPVELSSFSALVKGNSIELNWTTATETNNKGFEVQRLEVRDQKSEENWNVIGFVNGSGTTTKKQYYRFTDDLALNLNHNLTLTVKYRLRQIDFDGVFSYSKEIDVDASSPKEFSLSQNYPNPFNPTTTIEWRSPTSSWQTLKIYDVLGNEVATLVNEFKEAGSYIIEISTENFSSGIYYYQLKAGNFVETKKMILMK